MQESNKQVKTRKSGPLFLGKTTSGKASKVYPVIICGGVGKRLGPMSTEERPKQFLRLLNGRTLFQNTIERFSSEQFADPVVVSNDRYKSIITEEMEGANLTALITEPERKNTCAAILAAALKLYDHDQNSLMLVSPADHHIEEEDEFVSKVNKAAGAFQEDSIMVFGVKPNFAATQYGYIESTNHESVAEVSNFIEKPNLEKAEELFQGQNYFWNCGLFMAHAKTLINEIRSHSPDTYIAVKAAYDEANRAGELVQLDAKSFSQAPNISFDYAVMERTRSALMMPLHVNWTDLGSLDALKKLGII